MARAFGLTRGGARGSQVAPFILFPREMVLIVHGFPSAVAALRVRKEMGVPGGRGIGLRAFPGQP